VRTVFNVLGPLSNPAGATHQVVGVSDERLAPLMAEALARLGKRHALVVRGADGLDELTTTGTSRVWEVRAGHDVQTWELDPTAYGLDLVGRDELKGGDIADNVAVADAVLDGRGGPPTEVVVLNAGAALYTADAVADLPSGIERARAAISSGAARDLRDRWVARSQELAQAGS
jgi:anthranilate phosphoribosyltransferase